MTVPNVKHCDLAIIGAGFAGMSASLFAKARGVRTVLVGGSGESQFASGLFDVLGVHPPERHRRCSDPWSAIDDLRGSNGLHPYAKLDNRDILDGFDEIVSFLGAAGLSYRRTENRNVDVLTSLGTSKPTFGLPGTMWGCVDGLSGRFPCLIADIDGLRGFSARQIVETARRPYPHLSAAHISFPGCGTPKELHPLAIARALDVLRIQEALAETLAPLVEGFGAVGMPAVLGFDHSDEVVEYLERQLGIRVFEIPGMLPSVPGLRLREPFLRNLPGPGCELMVQKEVLEAVREKDGGFTLHVGNIGDPCCTLHARGVILASGRFIGGGLRAERDVVRESIFHLPVFQPADRTEWHRAVFLDPRGHRINLSGLETDEYFRPLDESGAPASATLFAAGSILAHSDWKRMKCGSGVAVATAFKAVHSFIRLSA